MQTGRRVRDWEKFLRALDHDPIKTVISHLTEQPPVIHLICERKSYNLSLDQIRTLYQLGRLPASIVAFLIIRGVLTDISSGALPDQENPAPVTDAPPE